MAVAMQTKKKLKDRTRQRRAFEDEEDEDMVIISHLENEPWQPDLLLERQSDKSNHIDPPDQRYMTHQSSPYSPLTSLTTPTTNSKTNANSNANGSSVQQSNGFQGVIPVIVKSPSSVITTADSDEDIFEDHAPEMPGIEEYIQQTHQRQQLLQQQQEMQMQMQLQLQYQMPAHLQTKNASNNLNNRRQQSHLHQDLVPQQYRNSFHGHTGKSHFDMEKEDEDDGEEEERPILQFRSLSVHEPSIRSESPIEKVMSDDEDVIESLQSLKNLTMLALDGLLQQVVSGVTASDPVHNPDETTLQARALIRRSSSPLLDLVGAGAGGQQDLQEFITQNNQDTNMTSSTPSSKVNGNDTYSDDTPSRPSQRSISGTPIAGLAASSFERLDELARKVDQLTAAAHNEHQQPSNTIAPFNRTREVLYEPIDIPLRQQQDRLTIPQQQQQQQQQMVRMDPSHVFESQEYQLACALAAMLACVYRILNHTQIQESRVPQRTESVDSGLDQASNLWRRLSSNNIVRNPLRPSNSSSPSTTAALQNRESITTTSAPSSPRTRVTENAGGNNSSGTTGFIQSINKQVRTLKSRRTQSTSHIEVGNNSRSFQGRLLEGLGFNSSGNASRSQGHQPRDAAQMMNSKELEHEWAELDKLMDEMGHLWRFVEGIEDSDETGEAATTEESAEVDTQDPFHDRNQIQQQPQEQQQQQQTTTESSMTANTTSAATTINGIDRQILDMIIFPDELPEYEDEAPQYKLSEKSESVAVEKTKPSLQALSNPDSQMQRRGNSGLLSGISGLDDEKTRFDLNNVMSAIERLSKVAPRLDNQRVQLTASQKRQMAQASVAHAVERLSKDRWDSNVDGGQKTRTSASAGRKSTARQRPISLKNRDLNKLVNQIVESAAKATSYATQRAEFSPRQQWKLEGARVGEKIERSERLRMSDQDWQSPENVLLKDMTRLTNALYQQSATTQAFATQRFTLTEDKERNMALQGIISKIERVAGRRMENQDAMPPNLNKHRSTPSTPVSMAAEKREREKSDYDNNSSIRVKELQDMINQVIDGGGGPTRKSAMASQRAQFGPRK
ncbi:hypothetical protein BGX21_005032 [Mortierella sp. AD011]|nr:hypothetical protein BGX20_000490 [Mortierella sp. AD010]KAF9400085.1 hypothetical protein BGX21_005032 [Mortierella sp. AD011]